MATPSPLALADLGPGFHLIPSLAHCNAGTRLALARRNPARKVAHLRAYYSANLDPMALQGIMILRGALADLREPEA